ncbi:YndJ family protein [Streptomyces sp. SKN60]|uniref:YndJ family protein n=1 Tax=Streptomyces sp. SKN60 TaxID=2855506 RepID=UPI002245CA6E|nr:YndJ family protein [Streptomyces sp. SKN60]MCX2184495.1 YndJ family protein [Streptomyces sp. SKN60]
MSVLVGLIVMLGMLVVVPVGLRLLDEPQPATLRLLRRVWPLLALPGAVALWLPRSPLAVALASVYALATLALALHAPVRLALTRSLAPAEIAALTALVTPAVAGLALVAERGGYELFGFELGILALTVPHFHFAGFAAALVAGLVCRTAERRGTRFAALSVPLGTLLVLLGYFVDDWAELAGALVLTAGMWAVALATWRELRAGAPDPVTRSLLATSAAVLVATMLLALSWALGEATGLPHPSLTWMAATHGLGNALGFALCSLLAWRRLAPARTAAPARTPVAVPAHRTELPA